MSITLEVSDAVERALRDKARHAGEPLELYLARVVEREAKRRSLDELAAPMRAAFVKSQMTEEELADLVQEAREEAWQERHAP